MGAPQPSTPPPGATICDDLRRFCPQLLTAGSRLYILTGFTVKIKVTLRPTVSQPVSPDFKPQLRPKTRLLLSDSCGFVDMGRPSLTRKRVCHLSRSKSVEHAIYIYNFTCRYSHLSSDWFILDIYSFQFYSESKSELLYVWQFTVNQFVLEPSPLGLTSRDVFIAEFFRS
jgi:hypothetical protein